MLTTVLQEYVMLRTAFLLCCSLMFMATLACWTQHCSAGCDRIASGQSAVLVLSCVLLPQASRLSLATRQLQPSHKLTIHFVA